MDYAAESLKLHYDWQGKIEVTLRAPLETADDLSLAYTPGVAQPCLEIQKDVSKSYDLTRRGNLVAVITDGTAVLGLGDIGPEAGMPVMEGKCALFKRFGNVDAIPLCVRSKNVDEIVETVRLIAGSFGGVNLEDISAPRCFEIERRLKECCDIPIFHDDQHGTAVVTLAAMLNALKLVGKDIHDIRVVTSGAGAAGLAIIRLLIAMGLDPHHVILCDRHGAIYEGRDDLNPQKEEMAKITNSGHKAGTLAEMLVDADVFIGVSAPHCVTPEMVKSMAKDPIIFAMANPTPEIMPDEALAAGAAVMGTGRIPGHLPWRTGRSCKRHQRRYEDRCRKGDCGLCNSRKAVCGIYHSQPAGRGCQRRCCKGSCTGCQGHRRSQSVTSDSTKRKSWDRGYCGLLSFFVDNVKSN